MIKKLSVKNSQDRIDNFFTTTRINLPEKGHFQSSKRVKDAIGKVLGKNPEINNESSSSIINISKNKRKSEDNSNNQPSTSKKVKNSDNEIKNKEIIVQPPKNWKQEEKSKAEEAKRKAIEVMKKTRQIEKKKPKKKNKKYVGSNLKRKILPTHNLSESDSD